MPHIKPPGTERDKGDKSRIYTDVRQKLAKMERDEWRAWFVECIDELQSDEAVWNWLTKETKFVGKFKGGKYLKKQDRVGRPFDWHKGLNYPDTRNLDWNEI